MSKFKYNLTVKQIANMLSVSESTIRMRIKKERELGRKNKSYIKIGNINLFDISYIEKYKKTAS